MIVISFDEMHKENPSTVRQCFTNLVFGYKCSPFVLNATVHHHLTKTIDFEEIKQYSLIYSSTILELHSTCYPTLSSFIALLNQL